MECEDVCRVFLCSRSNLFDSACVTTQGIVLNICLTGVVEQLAGVDNHVCEVQVPQLVG